MESADGGHENFETPGVMRRSRSTSDNIRENPLGKLQRGNTRSSLESLGENYFGLTVV